MDIVAIQNNSGFNFELILVWNCSNDFSESNLKQSFVIS